MLKIPDINPRYNALTLMNILSTSMHADSENEQWSKYFYIDGKELEQIQALFQKINDWHAVDNAEGITLDYLGNDFGVNRNGDDDPTYRFKIKSKRWIRKSDGTCNAMYHVVASCLDISPADFYIHNNENINQMVIDDIPADLVPDGKKIKWLMEQAQSATAFGIKIADIVFTQSFLEEHNVFLGTQDETEILNVAKTDNNEYTFDRLSSGLGFTVQTEVNNVTNNDDLSLDYNEVTSNTSQINQSNYLNIVKNLKEGDNPWQN